VSPICGFSSPWPPHGASDFTTPDGLLNYALQLVFIFLFNVPLLYGGIARAFNFTNAATSITLAFALALLGMPGSGLYKFSHWPRLFAVAISVFIFLPMLGNVRPLFADSFTAMTAFLPFVPLRAVGFLFQTRRCAATLCISPKRSGFVQAGLQEVRNQTRWQRVANCVASSAPDHTQKSRAVSR
jgi:hypothetical protein